MTIEAHLNRLKSTLKRARGIEAEVYWARGGEWSDATGETLEHEEIVYYAEGLLLDGFQLAWRVIGSDGAADLLELYFWQTEAPALPSLPVGMRCLETVGP